MLQHGLILETSYSEKKKKPLSKNYVLHDAIHTEFRTGKAIEIENRLVVVRAWGEGECGKSLPMCPGFLLG